MRWGGRHGVGLVAAVLVAMVLASLVPPPSADAEAAPSLRLIRSSPRVVLERSEGVVPLDLGVWVASVGGDFEVRARRPRYSAPVTATQVDAATGQTLREIPAELVDVSRGLKGFLHVSFRDAAGNVVARRRLAFCPSGGERQRVDDLGQDLSRYPTVPCSGGFPFVKGMVWGIDDHWAADALTSFDFFGLPTVRVPDGSYTVTVRIRRPHARLFGVPEADRTVTMQATVRQGHGGHAVAATTPEGGVAARPHQGVPLVQDPDPALLPDLVALPAWSIWVERSRRRDRLNFASTPWNAGPAPFVIEGFRRPDSNVMDAFQYFYDEDGAVVGRAPVGTLRYHDKRGHHHWHFLQFVSYELVDRRLQKVVRSSKQGFCILPTDAVDLTVNGGVWSAWTGVRTSVCGGPRSLWVREALDPGWGDTYFQVAGQAFDITDLPNGRYVIRVRVNPLGTVHQTKTANDVALRRVVLRGRPGARLVHVAPWRGIDG